MTLSVLAQMFFNALIIGSVYVLLAVGFNLVWGILGVFNFAHGHFYMLGAFLAWWLMASMGLGFSISFILTTVFIFILAAASFKLVLEPLQENEFVCVIASLGLVSLIEGVVSAIFGGEPRIVRLPISGLANFGVFVISYSRLATLGISFIVIVVFLYLVYFTKLGRAVRAAAWDPEIAQVQGINVSKIYLITFCIGTVLAGIGGMVASHMTPLMPYMGFEFALKAFVIVVIGGLGSIPGAVMGAMIIAFIESFIGSLINTTVATIVSFAVVLIILILKPSGLMGTVIK